jgi:uncharacterized membrane protein
LFGISILDSDSSMIHLLEKIPVIRHFSARPRLAFVTVAGLLMWGLLPYGSRDVTRALIAWDSAVGLYLILVAFMMRHSNPERIRRRAGAEDEGGVLILGLTIFTAIASLVAIIAELAGAKDLKGLAQEEHIGLAAMTVFLSWTFMQTMFSLHYAHEYYSLGADKSVQGLEFPGKDVEPDYWDFVYFSFIIGTAAQTADVNISSSLIRRVVTLHCVVVFFFNTTVLALTINIAASLF